MTTKIIVDRRITLPERGLPLRALFIASAVAAISVTTVGHTQQVAAGASNTEADSGTLEEVVVTAERRDEDLQKTAASVTTLGGDELRQQGRYTLSQILQDVPGVTGGTVGGIPSDNPGASILIRGVPSDPIGPGGSVVSSTAYYVDGVYGGIGGDYDINRVEVLRGPQGTLYGRSATSGVVSLYTRDPVLNQLGGDVTGELGSYDLHHASAALNLPIGDTLALRLAANDFTEHGYVSPEGGFQKEQELRAKLLWQPSADFAALVGYAYRGDHDNSGGATEQTYPNEPDSFYSIDGQPVFGTLSYAHQIWAKLDWNVGIGTLTYEPAYHTYASTGQQLIQGFIDQVSSEPRDQFVTHEVRLTSPNDSPIKWVVGGLAYDNKQDSSTVPHWLISGALVWSAITSKETRDYGTFAEATLPLAQTWRITAGVRYDNTRVQTAETYTQNNAMPAPGTNPFSPNWLLPEVLVSNSIGGDAGLRRNDNFTSKLRGEKDVTDANLVYAMVATGFLPADVTTNEGNGVPVVIAYAQEKLTSFEVGSKNRFLDNHFQVNGDVYYYLYTGYQQGANLQTNPAPNAPPIFAVLASPARMLGLELESVYLLSATDRFNLSVGHINAHFVDQPDTATDPFQTYVVQDKVPGIPPTTASLSYDHTFRLPGGSNLDLYDQIRYATGYDESSLNETQLAAGGHPYVQVGSTVVDDFNLGWSSNSSRYSATFYVHNVGNKIYKQGASVQSITPATGGTAQQIIGSLTTSMPRSYGLVLHASF